MSHTYAVLKLSGAAYNEIREKLERAGYQDQFHDELIDMHGIAISRAIVGELWLEPSGDEGTQ